MGGNGAGGYSFASYERPAPQEFAYQLGQTVADGVIGGVSVAGAGRVETGTSKDVYRFTVSEAQVGSWRFSGSNGIWARCSASQLLPGVSGGTSLGSVCTSLDVMLAAGEYRIEVPAGGNGAGSYTFASTPTPVTSATPTVTGTGQVGQTLTAVPGSWGPSGVSLAYQWLRNGTPIAGAVSPTYALSGADANTTISVKVTGSKQGYASVSKPSATVAVTVAGAVVKLAASRLVNTATNLGLTGSIGANATVAVQVTGKASIPTSGVAAVVATVTVPTPGVAGSLLIWASGATAPAVPQLVMAAASLPVTTTVVVPVGSDGKIQITNQATAATPLQLDVIGWVRAGTPTQPGTYTSVAQTRLATDTPVAAQANLVVTVAGTAGVPAMGAGVAVLSVSGTSTVDSQITGQDLAMLNLAAGQTRQALVLAPVSNGTVTLTNTGSETATISVDVVGYYLSGTTTAAGELTSLATPAVIRSSSSLAAATTATVVVTGVGGIPTTATGAWVVLTATGTVAGTVIVGPTGTTVPAVTDLTWTASTTITTTVWVPLGSDGKLQLKNTSTAAAIVAATVVAYTS